MWIEPDLTIRISPRLYESGMDKSDGGRWLKSFDGASLLTPRKFTPDAFLLKKHASEGPKRGYFVKPYGLNKGGHFVIF